MFRHRLFVRFRDCDALGHVNNAVYFTYLEQTRFHHWLSLGADIRDRAPGAPGFILARAECDFEAQATYGDESTVDNQQSTVTVNSRQSQSNGDSLSRTATVSINGRQSPGDSPLLTETVD